MSEYQYYDFRAIDRPLTSSQRAELGKISTRAEISSTSFTNFYTFGDFKGNPVALVERYFDAFLYLANWGTRELMFRVPLARPPAARVLRSYLSTRAQAAAWFRVRGTHVVIGFLSDDEEESWESDGEGELASIVPVRSDLLIGGVRVLYLGWLLRVQAGEVADDVTEPEVPAGLARLSGDEAALVEFLRMDHHLIAAAVQRRKGRPAKGRTVGDLLSIAKARREEAERRAAQRAQREWEKRAAAQAVTRARHLRALAAREADAWRDVEYLVESRKPAAYDQAVVLLQDLREICSTTGRSSRFTRFVDELRQRHRTKVSLLKRLDRAMDAGRPRPRPPDRAMFRRTLENYPGPATDAVGKIIGFCGGAGSRTWVRRRRRTVLERRGAQFWAKSRGGAGIRRRVRARLRMLVRRARVAM